jgi:hypothetical protein
MQLAKMSYIATAKAVRTQRLKSRTSDRAEDTLHMCCTKQPLVMRSPPARTNQKKHPNKLGDRSENLASDIEFDRHYARFSAQ